MRIISGTAGRRNIKVPNAVVRPTTDRTREALFSMINAMIEGAQCMDLFAGSGSLGLEALSRGAQSCTFVDVDRACVQVVRENLKALNLSGGNVLQSDILKYVSKRLDSESFNIIFADPPYCKSAGDTDYVAELLAADALWSALKPRGVFVAEMPTGKAPVAPPHWNIIAERNYGSCGIVIYQKGEK